MFELQEPKVYLLASTQINEDAFAAFLQDIGNPDWRPDPNVSGGENLIEAAGRLCYRSWQAYDPNKPYATNPNVTKVREGNRRYIKNILESGHGSVLEHVSMTFLLWGVSRIVTHELTRHRAGMAYSQESLRYVRLDNLMFWLPQALQGNEQAIKKFKEVVATLEGVQKELADLFDIDNIKDFHTKKQLTSMFRRLAPLGLGTSIIVTGNLRSWRHIIATRTSPAAEEEIRLVIGKVARICQLQYPNAFQDMTQQPDNSWVFESAKV